MKQEEKTQAEISAERIKNMPPHKDYIPVPDMPIPRGYGVIIKQLPPALIKRTGILLGDTTNELLVARGANSEDTCEGIVYGVGSACPADLKLGLRVIYDKRVETKFDHKGELYYKCDEGNVFFIVPDESTTVDNGVKTERTIGRGKRMARNDKAFKAIYKDEQNDLDKEKDKTKGKIRPVSTKK